MSSKEPGSPVETPTTPTPSTTPIFPLLPSLITSFNSIPDPNHNHGGHSPTSAAANTAMRRRNSSIISIPSSPLQNTLPRLLPMRPAKLTKTNKESLAPLYSPLKLQTAFLPTSNTTRQCEKSRIRSKERERSRLHRSRSPTPQYHVTVLASRNQPREQLRQRRRSAQHNPAYVSAFNHLETPLVPLISVTSGQPHPSFPNSLLQYHLLTHTQLDELAAFYHQVRPACDATFRYPAAVTPWVDADGSGGEGTSLETKRRRWGRFIGLRGCESPVFGIAGGQDDDGDDILEQMEREWKRALERREEEERRNEKSWRGRW